MKPVYQTRDPGRFGPTDNGDCLRACVASLLELPLEAVPHFMETAESARTWPVALRDWLSDRGLELDPITPSGNLQAVLDYMAVYHPYEHYILNGRSGPDFGHVVIGKGGEIVHDPSPRVPPGVVSLRGPLPFGRYLVMMIHPARKPVLPSPIDFGPLDRHCRIGLLFSGGKDSLALWHLFQPHLDRMTVYHVDSGDLMPETANIVRQYEARTPNFVRIKRDVRRWIAENGMPSELVPSACSPRGRAMLHGEAGGVPIVDKFECCAANIWQPKQERLAADGVTLTIQGTRRSEPGYGFVQALEERRSSAHIVALRGAEPFNELWLPIEDWSDGDVFAYLRSVGAPIAGYYGCKAKGPECARCPAFWDEGRASYLKQHHPALAADYAAQLGLLRDEILKPLARLSGELNSFGG